MAPSVSEIQKTPGSPTPDPQNISVVPSISLNQLQDHLTTCPKLFLVPKDLKGTAEKMARMAEELQQLGCPKETAAQLSCLVLYDLIVLLDDSYSMIQEEKGERIKTLKKVMRAICEVYELARSDGIAHVEFLNRTEGFDDVTRHDIEELLDMKWHGITPIGTVLKEKILDDLIFDRDPVLEPLTKPMIILTITDGDIEGEMPGTLEHNVISTVERLNDPSSKDLGADDIGFMFAKVGNNPAANDLLNRLDDDEYVGKYVDCFLGGNLNNIDSNNTMKWMILRKLLLGSIMPSVDAQDLAAGIEGEVKKAKLVEKLRRPRGRFVRQKE
ncbi:hypothetical protein EX30DRAFT_135738 [Ascodesmis nigricans]|uniref:VWFA domain-containing protein n=1 Tax=Ascodesmis nigricans TaxID=341454 RepID=A0A4S2MSC2_9PEZI|nr:hypothetical protein EX30DRAFT_135738 [Ascodesmis nigricans]